MGFKLRALGAAAFLAGSLGLASAATAAPVGPAAPFGTTASGLASDGLITRVAEGCGRGYFRNRRGFCRPMYRGRRVNRRRCYVRPGRYGPVRVCRF